MPRRKANTATVDIGPFTLESTEPIGPQVYFQLRRKIINLELKPGDGVSEALIADAAGVSKTPARQAVMQLVREGLLVSLPSRGTQVPAIDIQRMKDSFLIRSQVESEIARAVARSESRSILIAQLGEHLKAHDAALQLGDLSKIHAVDDSFHAAICDFHGSSLLWKVVHLARSESDRIHTLLRLRPETLDAALRHHRSITDSIQRGDVEGAGYWMHTHVKLNEKILEDIFQRHPEYFCSEPNLWSVGGSAIDASR